MPEFGTFEALDELIDDGMHIGIGGVIADRKPIAACRHLARSGVRHLTVSSFLGSLDIEVLVASGAVDTVRTGYVGYETRGGARAFRAALTEGAVIVESHSETTYTAGLRAAAAGLPFMPIRGATGSDIESELDLAEVEDPHGSGPIRVVAATPLDVAIIHADEVDRRGAVAEPPARTFLWDTDALLARAADVVVVTAERVVDRLSRPGLLTALDVDVVIESPDGAAPLGVGGGDIDTAWWAAYTADPVAAVAALAR